MNLLHTLRLPSPFAHVPGPARTLSVFIFLALITAPFTHAATDDTAQRQLREDRERFQREVERQTTDAKIRDDQARMAAEQQRTADELARLRAQQERQSSELRTLNETTRTLTTTPIANPAPRIVTSSGSGAPVSTAPLAPATITPDFSITILPDGNCVLYLKGRPPEVKSPAEIQTALQQLLAASKPAQSTP